MESSVKFDPLFNRVIIKREVQEKSKGGIILTDAKKHANHRGKIVALGETAGFVTDPGTNNQIRNMKVGDNVIFGKFAGAWLDASYSNGSENDDGTLYICKDEDILAIIKE